LPGQKYQPLEVRKSLSKQKSYERKMCFTIGPSPSSTSFGQVPEFVAVDVGGNTFLDVKGTVNRKFIGNSGLSRATSLYILFLIEQHSKNKIG
jgi:hypothetical protein